MKLIIVGAREDGHARVVLDAIHAGGEHTVAGFVDDNPALHGSTVLGFLVLGGVAQISTFRKKFESAIIAIGDNTARMHVSKEIKKLKIPLATVIHPRAVVAADVKLGSGTFVAAGAVINPGTTLGEGVIINTGATVDHDSLVGDYVHIGPGVHTAGRVHVGEGTFLGIGSRVIPDITIGKNVIVGAGAVVLHDVPDGATCVGVPAHVIKIDGVPVNE